MALQPWQKGTVIRIEDYTPNTKRYWIKVPDISSFDFIPGQFVTLDLPIHEKPNKRWRSYSIASWPDGTNVFELLIVLAEGGAGTHYLFSEISTGSELTFRGPQGVFVLPKELHQDIFFICTGTGLAPFRSMINYIHLHQIQFERINLVFGCRRKENLLYYEEMRAFEKELPGFHYYPTLSREQWEGDHGYVHPVYQRLCESRQPALFYLCGWKNMIDDAKKNILEMGYDKKAVHLELYG